MLKRNIKVEAGLVNGALGTLSGFDTQRQNGSLEVSE